MSWVDWFNTSRLHGSLGYVPPVEFEAAQHEGTVATALVGAPVA